MNTLNSMNEIGWDRRRFFSVAAASVAATQLGMVGPAKAQMKVAAIRAGTNTSFAPLKQIDAGVLNVGYAEAGPANGEPVILLHGWPYDIHSFVDVTPLLASARTAAQRGFCRGSSACEGRRNCCSHQDDSARARHKLGTSYMLSFQPKIS